MVLASLLLLSLPNVSGMILFLLSFSFAPSFLSFVTNYLNFFKAPFIISGRFSESILLCKIWSNFPAIVTRISGIPSSLSSIVLLLLSNSASINKLNINKYFFISLLSISTSGCLLLIVTDISLCSSFIFLISLFLLQNCLIFFYLLFYFSYSYSISFMPLIFIKDEGELTEPFFIDIFNSWNFFNDWVTLQAKIYQERIG